MRTKIKIRKPRTYTEAYVEQLRHKVRELEQQVKHQDLSWDRERSEVRRCEALIDTRWDEMQRLRDLIFAIATKSSPRNVVEREIEKLGGAMEAKPK